MLSIRTDIDAHTFHKKNAQHRTEALAHNIAKISFAHNILTNCLCPFWLGFRNPSSHCSTSSCLVPLRGGDWSVNGFTAVYRNCPGDPWHSLPLTASHLSPLSFSKNHLTNARPSDMTPCSCLHDRESVFISHRVQYTTAP
jgi:hypothetical protein